MAGISSDSWIESFQSFLSRQELPLSSCSPNRTPVSGENGKFVSPLTKASQIINSLTEQHPPELITLAFRIIYLKNRNSQDLHDIIKKHQRYIVLLSSRQNPNTNRHELSTLGQVLSGTKQFNLLSWNDLLNLKVNPLSFPTAIVASYYFFVLQGVLQDVSTNLNAVTKPQSGLGLPLFWDVARLFLIKSQFSRCLEGGDETMREKYAKNKTKILSGFIKILKYLLQKKDGHIFKTILIAFELKLSETLLLEPIDLLNLGNEQASDMLIPFFEDYKNSSCVSDLNAMDSDTSLEIVSVQHMHDSPSLKHRHQEKVEQFLERLSNEYSTPEIVADTIKFIKSCRTNEATFERVLQVLVPPLKTILNKSNFVDQMKVLARVCFEYGNAASSSIGLRLATELDILSCTSTKNRRDLSRIWKRIEFSIWSILNLKESSIPEDLIQSYLGVAIEVHVDESFTRMAAECLAQDFQTGRIFFGQDLRLSPLQQSSLLESFCPILAKRLPPDAYSIISDLYNDLKTELSLTCIYALVCHFRIQVDLSAVTSQRNFDALLFVAIKTESLQQQIPSESVLKEIDHYFNQWIDAFPGLIEDEAEEEIILRILNRLYHACFYNLCISFIQRIRSLVIPFTTKTGYELEMVLCEATMRSGKVSSAPDLLKQAGLCLKKMALENKHGVLPLHVVRWKLLQLDFYLKSNDYQKLASKIQETGKLISTTEEFQLDSNTSSICLSEKLLSLLILARFHLYVAQYEYSRSNFAEAIQEVKFSIKLTKSVLRKFDCLLDQLLAMSQNILTECLRIGYMYYRHVGLAKEAKTFLNDLSKVNKALDITVKLSYGHFDLTNSLVYVGERSKAYDEFKEGSKITNTTGFEALDLMLTMGAMSLKTGMSVVNGDSLGSKVKQFRDRTNQLGSNLFQALSSTEVTDLFVLLNLNMASNALAESAVIADCAKTNRHLMLTKALFVVRDEVKSICKIASPRFYMESSFNFQAASTATDHLRARLIENKSCLQKMLEQEYFVHLDNNQQREASHLFRICSIMGSSLLPTAKSEQKTELAALVQLEEVPRRAPYEYYHFIAKQSKKNVPQLTVENELLSNVLMSQDIHSRIQNTLPEDWIIVSLDICSITGDLIISRLRAQEPTTLILNVPMPSNVNLQSIVNDLNEIIAQSNLSTKSSVTTLVKTKEDRKNWWRHRFNLDIQLQDLLSKVESVLVGVRGAFQVFNPHSSELKEFSESLCEIFLQTFKELPSNWSIETNLSELFYGLVGQDNEDKSIETLIKMVIDQLGTTFNFGKCDLKIAKAVEKIKSLKKSPQRLRDGHTILITSDVCTPIPWESLGLFRKKSVTRMPNLLCTLALITNYQEMKIKRCQKNELSYVINPGQDLKRTESIFLPIFNDLEGATGIIGESPTEPVLEDLIHNSNLFVFMGHGGGEQYMRMSVIMKGQETETALPPALLMGCSSCGFQKNGQLPMSSNIFDWLVHGSPIVVANLWDVTDKDIDLFTLSMLESWGVTLSDNKEGKSMSLAVAESREKCILKYLNGAAPVVYGLPLTYR